MRHAAPHKLRLLLLVASLLSAASSGVSARSVEGEIADIVSQLQDLPIREPGETGGSAGIYLDHLPGSPTTVTVDLGQLYPIDHIALIPARLQNVERVMEVVGFPSRFDIIGAQTADFTTPIHFQTDTEADTPRPEGYPVLVAGNGKQARYIRVAIYEAPPVRGRQAVSLAELFVFSEGRNVALKKPVEAPTSVSWEGFFDRSFLVDGQTPLGQPSLAREKSSRARGWHAKVQTTAQSDAFIELRFEEAQEIEEIRLYPVYHSLWPRSTDYGFPIHFRLKIEDAQAGWTTIEDWSQLPFPRPGNSPVYFPVAPLKATAIRLEALELPQSIPSRFIFALAEIEVLADGINVANEANISSSALHTFSLTEWNEQALVDGYTTGGKIIPLLDWLEGLVRRGELEARLDTLRDQGDRQQQTLTRILRITVGVLSFSLLTAGGLLFYNRTKRQKQLKALQSQIASDLHDDIGSNLASMTILAAGLHEQCPADSPQANSLRRIIDIGRETASSMHDIVWMLHPDRKANIGLTAKLRDIANSLLADSHFTFEGADEVGADRFSMDTLHHFLLFYKETLHNLVRHGNADLIQIECSFTRKRVQLRIIDDGNPPPTGKLPDGLILRAKKLSAELSYRSDADKNHLTLVIP